jgi:hypothetical protein
MEEFKMYQYHDRRNKKIQKKKEDDQLFFWIGIIGFAILMSFFVN